MRSIKRLIIHHSASHPNTRLEDITQWHISRGFRTCGYHYVIEGSGKLRVGRPIWEDGAHAKGSNHDSIGVCVVGDNTKPEWSWNELQEDSLLDLIDSVEKLVPGIKVLGHRDTGQATECPGLDIDKWLKGVL